MAMRIRMKYNPYLCKVNLSILSSKGSEEKIDGNAADEIEEHFGDRFCLEDDGDQLLDIILESYRGSQITIEFVGTNENFQFFYKLCSKRQISLEKSSNQRILSCDEISRKITDKVMQLKSLGYDIDCNGEIDKILDATIPVVVVGNMSAGKSTFLNALIGEELLPSGQNRTTGVNCALHNSPKEVRVEYCAKGKMVSLDCVNLSASKNQALIPGELFSIIENEPKPINRVRCVIDYFNYKDDSIHLDRTTMIDNKLLSVFCPFYNKEIPEQIVFFDTPGGDSDVFKDDAVTLENALKGQTKGFLIFVCAERKDLDKSQNLIDTVQAATGNKLDLAHTIVVCNHTEEEPDCDVQTSTEKEWASRIIYASAAVALGARKPVTSGNSGKEKKLFSIYTKNSNAFSEPSNVCYISLPQYCSLPNSRKDGIESMHEELKRDTEVATDAAQKKNQLMQFNSGITTIEQEIIYVAKELFPYNQCERARRVFLKLLEDYRIAIVQKEESKESQRKSRIAEFESIYEPLCKDLKTCTDEYVCQAKEKLNRKIKGSDYKWTKEKAGDFATHAIDGFLNIDFYSEHNEESIREKIAALLDTDVRNYTKRAEQDFNEFLVDTALPEYTLKCKQRISNQAYLSESEKQVFESFFTIQKLVDQTSEKRKSALKGVELNIPKLIEKLSGDKWYTIAWKIIVNSGKKAKYWVEKNLGSIKGNLALYHENAYIENSESILAQTNQSIEEIFERIKDAFSDESADDNLICNLNPELGDIKRVIQELSRDIRELDNRKRRIEGELSELSNVFSNVK